MYKQICSSSFKFMTTYNHTPTKIIMNKNDFESLFKEMYGNQWFFLIKAGSVMGLQIIIDEVDCFVISDGENEL